MIHICHLSHRLYNLTSLKVKGGRLWGSEPCYFKLNFNVNSGPLLVHNELNFITFHKWQRSGEQQYPYTGQMVRHLLLTPPTHFHAK